MGISDYNSITVKYIYGGQVADKSRKKSIFT